MVEALEKKYKYELWYADGTYRQYNPVTLLYIKNGQFIPRIWEGNRPIKIAINPPVDTSLISHLLPSLHPAKGIGILNGEELIRR